MDIILEKKDVIPLAIKYGCHENMSQVTYGRRYNDLQILREFRYLIDELQILQSWSPLSSSWWGCTSLSLLQPVTEGRKILGWHILGDRGLQRELGSTVFTKTFLELLHSLIFSLLNLPSFSLTSSELDMPLGLTSLPASSNSLPIFSSHLFSPLV